MVRSKDSMKKIISKESTKDDSEEDPEDCMVCGVKHSSAKVKKSVAWV